MRNLCFAPKEDTSWTSKNKKRGFNAGEESLSRDASHSSAYVSSDDEKSSNVLPKEKLNGNLSGSQRQKSSSAPYYKHNINVSYI